MRNNAQRKDILIGGRAFGGARNMGINDVVDGSQETPEQVLKGNFDFHRAEPDCRCNLKYVLGLVLLLIIPGTAKKDPDEMRRHYMNPQASRVQPAAAADTAKRSDATKYIPAAGQDTLLIFKKNYGQD
jgi:hypothetical protein